MYKSIYLSLCLTLLLSCKKKEQESLTLSGNYISSATAVVSNTAMYTKTGVTTNWTAINQFLEGQGIAPGIFDVKEKTLINNVVKISIEANGQATVNLYSEQDISGRIIFSGHVEDLNSRDFVIRAPKPDSALSFGRITNNPIELPITPRSFYIDQYGNIGEQDFDSGISVGPPGQYINVSTKKQFLIIKDNELYLPMLLYSFKRITEFSIKKYRINEYTKYNLLNPNVQQVLGERDTLVAQQFLIKLIKQP